MEVNQLSSYTITIKEMVDLYTIDSGANLKDKIEIARPKLFDFDYPVFDPAYKNVFETHFIRNFLMREIGFESEGLFKLMLENWLNINMPYFNKMFESESLTFDPLANTKVDTTHNNKKNNTSHQTSATDGTNNSSTTQDGNGTLTEDNFDRQVKSDTPDTRLNITTNDGQGVIEYASEIDENSENNSKTSTNHATASANETTNVNGSSDLTSDETEDFTANQTGKIGSQSFSKLLQEYRETFLRIEKDIFKEMSKELFMLVY